MNNNERQLMFSDDMNVIVEEPINFWKNMNDVPEYIKNFIISTSGMRVIYDSSTKGYYCSKCLKLLDDNYYCSNCSLKYKKFSLESKYVIRTSIDKIRGFYEKCNYFVFDIVDGNVLLYVFSVEIRYDCHFLLVPYQICNVEIEKVYHVTELGITDLINNKFLSFMEYDKYVYGESEDFELFEVFEVPDSFNNFLYIDNLRCLQNTNLYKYTSIWELDKYLEYEYFTLSSLTYYPVHFKQFEYLVKMKLYNLACHGSNMIKKSSNFKESFGVSKDYYSFMRDNNISVDELEALRIYPTTDIEVIKFISKDLYLFKALSNYVKFDKLKRYFEEQKLEQYNVYEYYDYIKYSIELGLDIKDNKILYPDNFIYEHDRLSMEIAIVRDPDIDRKIHALSEALMLNIYEDDKFIIFPADSIHSLVDESRQMSNCVRNYSSRICNYECQIYFMRYKNKKNKSLVTVEVRDGRVIQARTRFNNDITLEMRLFLNEWEKHIILVEKGCN